MAAKRTHPHSADDLPSVPTVWPGAFGLYKYSKRAIRPNVWTLIQFYLTIYIVATVIVLALFQHNKDGRSFVYDLAGVLSNGGLIVLWLGGVRQRSVSLGEAISASFNYFLKVLGVSILTTLIWVVSFLLLVVPFFFVFPRLVLAPYFLIDKDQGIIEAIRSSWNLTKGHAVKVWSIILATIAMALLVITIIGIPFAIYFLIMYSAANAVLYEFILQHADEQAVPNSQPKVTA